MERRVWMLTAAAAAVLLLVLLGTAAGGAERVRESPVREGDEAVFLPAVSVGRGRPLNPTLGPSPTPTRTRTPTAAPTWGPSVTPGATHTPTPPPAFEVLKAGCPEDVRLGESVVFTIGLINRLDGPVLAVVEDSLPSEMSLRGIWPPIGSACVVSGNRFLVTATVSPGQALNMFVSAVVTEVCDCYTENTVTWRAVWAGGSGSGTATSGRIFLSDAPTPTATPAGVVTPPLPTATPAATLPTSTLPPTLGPSPTPTPPP